MFFFRAIVYIIGSNGGFDLTAMEKAPILRGAMKTVKENRVSKTWTEERFDFDSYK